MLICGQIYSHILTIFNDKKPHLLSVIEIAFCSIISYSLEGTNAFYLWIIPIEDLSMLMRGYTWYCLINTARTYFWHTKILLYCDCSDLSLDIKQVSAHKYWSLANMERRDRMYLPVDMLVCIVHTLFSKLYMNYTCSPLALINYSWRYTYNSTASV